MMQKQKREQVGRMWRVGSRRVNLARFTGLILYAVNSPEMSVYEY